MNYTRKTMLFLLAAAMLLSACGAQQPPASPTPDVNAILTESIGTLSAAFFLTQTALVPPATNTPLPTPTLLPTNTPLELPSPLPSATQGFFATAIVYPSATPTGTYYTPTANPSTLAYGCNNLRFLQHETVPMGTEFQPGEGFTKTWKVENNGTCEWTLGYRVVFVSGSQMEGSSTRPNNPIPPGKWTQLSVRLQAPSKEGTYTGYWQLSDGAGHTFGATLPVSIVVKRPPSYP